MAASKKKGPASAPVEHALDNKNLPPATTALAETSKTTEAVVPASVYDEFKEDAEQRKSGDFIIQRYRCVQAMTKDRAALGLQEGQFYGSMTKVQMKSAVVIPVYEEHHVVERTADDTGTFIGLLKLDDPRVEKAKRENKHPMAGQNPMIGLLCPDTKNKLVETRDVHVAFIDPDDLLADPTDYGVLQFDSTNLGPWQNAKDARMKTKGCAGLALYFFRILVEVEPHKNKKGQISQKFKLMAFGGDGWAGEKCKLDPTKPDHYAYLLKLKSFCKDIKSGKVAVERAAVDEVGGTSEAAAEQAEF